MTDIFFESRTVVYALGIGVYDLSKDWIDGLCIEQLGLYPEELNADQVERFTKYLRGRYGIKPQNRSESSVQRISQNDCPEINMS